MSEEEPEIAQGQGNSATHSAATARARWRRAGNVVQAVHRFQGIPALLPRPDTSDCIEFPDTKLHRPVAWSLGACFAIIFICYVASVSHLGFGQSTEADFDEIASHSLPLLGLIGVLFHLWKESIKSGTSKYNKPFSRLPIHLQSAFSGVYVSTCIDFFIFIWAFDLLWIRDHGEGNESAWLAKITPVAIVLYTTISLLNLHQRQSWAWAAIVHHVFLLTAPVMFLDPLLRHRFCSDDDPLSECRTAVLRIYGIQLWGESFDLILGIGYIVYLTGCRSHTLRVIFSIGIITFIMAKTYAFVSSYVHSLGLFLVDFSIFARFYQAWFIVSLVMWTLGQGFELYGVLVLLGRLDILNEYTHSFENGKRFQSSKWFNKYFYLGSLAARAHQSAYRGYVSELQGYKVPLLISVWDDKIIRAEYIMHKRAQRSHQSVSHVMESSTRNLTLVRQQPDTGDGSSQKNSNQVDSVEKLVADVNGVEIGALFDESSL